MLVGSGYLTEQDFADLDAAGAVGDVIGRFLDVAGSIALPELDERTVGLPLDELAGDRISIGLAAGAGRGPIALAALRAGCVNIIVVNSVTAEWVLAHG